MGHSEIIKKHNEAEALVDFTSDDVTVTGIQFSRVLDEKCRIVKDPVKMADNFCKEHPNYVVIAVGQFTVTCATRGDAKKLGIENPKPTVY